MHGELVATTTTDQVRLNGFLLPAQNSPQGRVDGVVVMHGLAGNFYSSPLLLNLAARFTQAGTQSVVGNSRGHDLLNWTIRAGRSQTIGSALEDVGEAPRDLNSWVEFLARRGSRNVLLVGHSLGAIKTLYTLAHDYHPIVVGAVALSPTRLNYEQFRQSRLAPVFLNALERARELVSSDRGTELIQVQFPFPTWMSAQAYLDKYGPANRFDWLAFAERISLPTLVVFGELELRDHGAFEGLEPQLASSLASHPWIEWRILEGADHFYVARVNQVCDLAADWMAEKVG